MLIFPMILDIIMLDVVCGGLQISIIVTPLSIYHFEKKPVLQHWFFFIKKLLIIYTQKCRRVQYLRGFAALRRR